MGRGRWDLNWSALGHPLDAVRAAPGRSTDGYVDWLITIGRAFTAASTLPTGGHSWGGSLIIGTLFPPALLWAAISPAQTVAARALTFTAAIALAAFGYVVWVLLFGRMAEIDMADRERRAHRRADVPDRPLRRPQRRGGRGLIGHLVRLPSTSWNPPGSQNSLGPASTSLHSGTSSRPCETAAS